MKTVLTITASLTNYNKYVASGLWKVVDTPKWHKHSNARAVVNALMKGGSIKPVEIIILNYFPNPKNY